MVILTAIGNVFLCLLVYAMGIFVFTLKYTALITRAPDPDESKREASKRLWRAHMAVLEKLRQARGSGASMRS